MCRHGDPNTGLDGNSVRRWEAGERWPEPRFRRHLVLVFGKSASQLGLLTPEELAARPSEASRAPGVLSAIIRRTSDNKSPSGLFVASAGLPEESTLNLLLAQSDARSRGVTTLDSATYDGVTSSQWSMYWSMSSDALYEAAIAHTHLGVHLLRSANGRIRHDVARSVAQSALLVGRLGVFDLRQPAVAERYLAAALLFAREGRDPALSAAAMAHQGLAHSFSGRHRDAEAAMIGARAHLRRIGGPRLRSWVHAVSAEIVSRGADARSTQRHLGRAEAVLDGAGDDPGWLDFYDVSRFPGFAGNAQLLVGQPAVAATYLRQALEELAPEASRQRAVLLFDLATALAASDAEEAATHGAAALEVLASDWYAVALERLPKLLKVLDGTGFESALEEQAAELILGRSYSSGAGILL